MKRNYHLKFIGMLMGISAFFLFSCSPVPENLTAVPKEANAVAVVNLYSIAQKGKLNEIAEKKFFRTLKKELQSESTKLSRLLDDIMEDPGITGIDMKTDIFAYVVPERKREQYICLSAKLNNEEKFGKFIKDILKASEADFDSGKEKSYQYINIDGEAVIAWDAKKAVLLFKTSGYSKHLETEIEEFMTLKPNNQITSNEDFKKFYKNKKDISFWVSTNLLDNDYTLKELAQKTGIDYSDSYVRAYLGFDKGKLSLLTQFSPNNELKKTIQEYRGRPVPFNNNLLQYLPETSYGAVSLAFDPVAYNAYLKKNGLDAIKDVFDDELDIDLDELGIDRVKEFFESFKGSFLFSVFDFKNIENTYLTYGYTFNEQKATKLSDTYTIWEAGDLSDEDKEALNQGKTVQCNTYSGRYSINIQNILNEGGNAESAIENGSEVIWYEGGWEYGKNVEVTREEMVPMMGLAFDINSSQFIKKLIKEAEESVTKQKDYYKFNVDHIAIYLVFNEHECFLTTDKKAIEAFQNNGFSENLSKNPIKAGMTKSLLYGYCNLNFDKYPNVIKEEIKSSFDNNSVFKQWSGFARDFEIRVVDPLSCELIFNLQNDKENSLYSIIHFIDYAVSTELGDRFLN